MRVKKNDIVVVLKGRDRGKRGKVLEILDSHTRVRVEGVHMAKRHVKAGRDKTAPQGGIIEVASPIQLANVRLICSKCSQPTEARTRTLEDGKRVRACKKCNETLDK